MNISVTCFSFRKYACMMLWATDL